MQNGLSKAHTLSTFSRNQTFSKSFLKLLLAIYKIKLSKFAIIASLIHPVFKLVKRSHIYDTIKLFKYPVHY